MSVGERLSEKRLVKAGQVEPEASDVGRLLHRADQSRRPIDADANALELEVENHLVERKIVCRHHGSGLDHVFYLGGNHVKRRRRGYHLRRDVGDLSYLLGEEMET